MEDSLRLNAASLNGKLAKVEEALTLLMDQMDILALEMEELKGVWQSGAYAEWREELARRILEWELCVNRLWELASQVSEAAEDLAKTEQKNILRAYGVFQ